MNTSKLSDLSPLTSPLDQNLLVALTRRTLPALLLTASVSLVPALHAQQQQSYDPQAMQDAQQVGQLVDASQDPPSRVARLSVLQGNVSFQPAADPGFTNAELNYPLTSGDRLYTDNGSRAELEAGQLTLRLGATADATVTSLTDDNAQFGLAQGSAHLRAYALDPNTTTELDTPNASIGILTAGDYRVDVYPSQGPSQPDTTIVTVFSGQVQVSAQGVQQVLTNGQCFQITGFNGQPAQAQLVRRQRIDELDQFSFQRDQLYQQQLTQNAQNVNPDTIGYADLGQYGDWQQAPPPDAGDNGGGDDGGGYTDGPVWFPSNVAVDWQPYSVGHWAYIAPWGWTWVESEPWGFAPFHYGRWARFHGRWGWIPGPPVIHPVYSPALVVFVGGPGFHLGVGGGVGVAAWFPLGPREVYQPPYRTGPGYINRINVTNIYTRNTVEVRSVYNNRTVNIYANGGPARPAGTGGFNRPGGPPQYVNRNIATVAVPQDKFASGRPVAANALHVDPRQFANAPINNRAPVAATRPGLNPAGAVNSPRALPPGQSRPVLANQGPAASQNAPRPGGRSTVIPGGTVQQPNPTGYINNGPPQAQPRQLQTPGPRQASPQTATPPQGQPPAPSNNRREGLYQPQPSTPPPTAPAPPANNNYRRGPVQAPPAAQPEPPAPAPPANNNYRRGPVQAPPAAQPEPAAPAPPASNNYRRGPVETPRPQQQPAAPSPPPARPAPLAAPAAQRPGAPAPQRPAPPAPPEKKDDRKP